MSGPSSSAFAPPTSAGGCAQCGAEITSGARFCAQCGRSLPDTQTWHTPAFVTAMVVLFCVMMSLQLFVTPTFEKMHRDFAGVLPWATKFVLSGGGLGASVVLLLLAGLNVARFRRGSTGRTVAGWGAIVVGLACLAAMIVALYLPVFVTAGAIK